MIVKTARDVENIEVRVVKEVQMTTGVIGNRGREMILRINTVVIVQNGLENGVKMTGTGVIAIGGESDDVQAPVPERRMIHLCLTALVPLALLADPSNKTPNRL